MRVADHITRLHHMPTALECEAWHRVAVRVGPNDAWLGYAIRLIRQRIPGWTPMSPWRALPGTFTTWERPFDMWLVFENPTDKTRLDYVLSLAD